MKKHHEKSSPNTSKTVTTNDDARSAAVVNPSINDPAIKIDPAMEAMVVGMAVVVGDGVADPLETIGIMITDEVVVAVASVVLKTDEEGRLTLGVAAVEDIETTTEEEEEGIKVVEDIRIEGVMVVVGMVATKDMGVERTTEVEEATAVGVAMEATATSSSTNSPNNSSSTTTVDNNSPLSSPPSSTPSRHKEATATTTSSIRITNSTDSKPNRPASSQLHSPTNNSTRHTINSRAHINRADTRVVTAIRLSFLSSQVKREHSATPPPAFVNIFR